MHKYFHFDSSNALSADELDVYNKTLLLKEPVDHIDQGNINTDLNSINSSKEIYQINSIKEISWNHYHFKNAYLIIHPGLDGIVFFKDNIFLKDQLKFFRKPIFNHLIHAAFTGKLEIKKLDKLFIPFDAGWNNYYHFLLSCIVRMKLYDEKSGFRKPKIGLPHPDNFNIVPNINPAFTIDRKNEILQAFNINPGSIQLLKPGIYKVANLHTIFSNIKQLRYNAFSKYLQNLFNNVKIGNSQFPESYNNVFLSRSQSNNQRPLDKYEDMIIEKNHSDFKKVILDGMSFKEQINIFRTAKNIAGFHGAALTNLLFAQDDIENVWEYMSETKKGEDPRLHFYDIALAKKISYKGEYIHLP